MKKFYKILLLFFATILVSCLGSCSLEIVNKSDLVDTWIRSVTLDSGPGFEIMTFNADGTGSDQFSDGSVSSSFTWEMSGRPQILYITTSKNSYRTQFILRENSLALVKTNGKRVNLIFYRD